MFYSIQLYREDSDVVMNDIRLYLTIQLKEFI